MLFWLFTSWFMSLLSYGRIALFMLIIDGSGAVVVHLPLSTGQLVLLAQPKRSQRRSKTAGITHPSLIVFHFHQRYICFIYPIPPVVAGVGGGVRIVSTVHCCRRIAGMQVRMRVAWSLIVWLVIRWSHAQSDDEDGGEMGTVVENDQLTLTVSSLSICRYLPVVWSIERYLL